MLENLPKMLLEISQNFPIMLGLFPIMLDYASYVYTTTTTISSSQTLQQLLLCLLAVTWSTILRQFTKNYDLFQDTTPNVGIMPA